MEHISISFRYRSCKPLLLVLLLPALACTGKFTSSSSPDARSLDGSMPAPQGGTGGSGQGGTSGSGGGSGSGGAGAGARGPDGAASRDVATMADTGLQADRGGGDLAASDQAAAQSTRAAQRPRTDGLRDLPPKRVSNKT